MLGPFATASRHTPHYHSPGVATVASHADCASMSTTTTTTTTTATRDRWDRYGPMEWAQQSISATNREYLCHEVGSHAGLRWYKLLLHHCSTVLIPRGGRTVSYHIVNVAASSLHTSYILTALSCKSSNKTCVQLSSVQLQQTGQTIQNNNNYTVQHRTISNTDTALAS